MKKKIHSDHIFARQTNIDSLTGNRKDKKQNFSRRILFRTGRKFR